MKIVVCVKQVPDTAAKVVVANGEVTWGDAPLVLNPWDEYAVETALQLVEEHGGEVTVISMGGEDAKEALKHSLAMGSSQAILISDPGLKGADSLVTAHVLAAAIQKVGDVDLALFGKQAIDGDLGVTSSQTARLLGWPAVTLVSTISGVDEAGKSLKAQRSIEEGRQNVSTSLPAVMSVVKDIGEPRYPSFMGIRKASRADIPVWSLADLDVDAPEPSVSWPQVMNPPERKITNEIISGDSPQEIAEKLADKLMEEKVL